jgi:tetratricopeptide (TPR) repeat protein
MWSEGQQMISGALRVNEENAEYWHYLAKFESEMGRYAEAARDAQRAIELLVSDPEKGMRIGEEFEEIMKEYLIVQPNGDTREQ